MQSLQHGDGVTLVVVRLPSRWSEITSITRVVGTTRSTTARRLVTEHHRERLVPSARVRMRQGAKGPGKP